MLSPNRLDELLRSFDGLRIALVGDLFLDRYLYIEPDVEERSIETGLEAYQVTSVRNSPGALGTIINNLAAMGVRQIQPCTVIGNDGHAEDLLTALAELSVDASGIVRCPNRLTPTYTKPMKRGHDGHWRELNRFDFRDRGEIAAEAVDRLLRGIERVIDDVDGVIILDQIDEPNWGVINDTIRDYLRDIEASRPNVLFFSDSRRCLKQFDFGVLKCNAAELRAAHENSPIRADRASLEPALLAVARRTGHAAFCTLGSDGILCALANGECQLAAGIPVSGETDIVGAGDSASSAIVCSLLCGASEFEAAEMGNLAASITVQKIGETGVASADEIRGKLRGKPLG